MNKINFHDILKTRHDGTLQNRERHNLEYKKDFQFKSMAAYLKTIAAFSNNKGGIIVFGISDNPRKIIGMDNNQFDSIDTGKITEYLNKYFSPEIHWEMKQIIINEKKIGFFIVYESKNKPIICKISVEKLNEGDIYYRYRGRSEKIRYPEVQKIFKDIEEKEKRIWMEHIEQIAKIGPKNISFIDLVRGEIPRKNGQSIVIDKKILQSLKFVKEYESVEKDGAEALKIIGEIQGLETIAPEFNLEKDFYTAKELGKELGWLTEKGSPHYISRMIECYKLKEKSDYCQHKNKNFYYTPKCLDFFQEMNLSLDDVKEFIKLF